MPGKRWLYCILWVLLGSPLAGHALVTVNDPGTYVVDKAGIIDADTKRKLEGWLRELQQKTTAQVKVLTVPTTEGEDIFGFSQRHAEAWKLGQQGKDNGALIALALKDRKIRLQTGYGLEGVLPDSWAGTISREVAQEFFKAGNYSEGLLRMTVATAKRVADAAGVELTGLPKHRPASRQRGSSGTGIGATLVPLLIFFFFLSAMRRRGRHYSRWGW
jgi:uncharacterized protein